MDNAFRFIPLTAPSVKTATPVEAKVNMSLHLEIDELSKEIKGVLSKYTNVMKGWQYRWFELHSTDRILIYFEKEEQKKSKPRAVLQLLGAVVAPSEDDSVTFTIHAVNGEVYRLRSDNAGNRRHWVSYLRLAADTSTLSGGDPSMRRLSTSNDRSNDRSPRPLSSSTWYSSNSEAKKSKSKSSSGSSFEETNPALGEVKEYVHEMYNLEECLIDKIDHLPLQGAHMNALDEEMLVLKACSSATVECLEQCVSLLEQKIITAAREKDAECLPAGSKIKWNGPIKPLAAQSYSSKTQDLSTSAEGDDFTLLLDHSVPPINHADEEADPENSLAESDIDSIEQHKSVILHLLSQLKLGMDLTKVVLPTFILEKRSLLEMFADCMAHPDLFISIPENSNAETRMIQVVEWYLTSFHEGRKGTVAKKPYNPIIGETFHCSWEVPCTKPASEGESANRRLVYTAEQVSHHPPVSAFHVACDSEDIELTGSIWTKSKFMGMSIGVTMVGNLTLSLAGHNEEYVMTLPSAYARSILTYPWVELGDKCSITCQATGYSANIIFHTKPFYGGKLHRITGEVKNKMGVVISQISGAWNGTIQLAGSAGNKTIDTTQLSVTKKRVRPISKQGELESRRLWKHVTNALKLNDINTATDHKSLLEAKQRENERHRKEHNLQYPTKYFTKRGQDVGQWVYKR